MGSAASIPFARVVPSAARSHLFCTKLRKELALDCFDCCFSIGGAAAVGPSRSIVGFEGPAGDLPPAADDGFKAGPARARVGRSANARVVAGQRGTGGTADGRASHLPA